MQEFLKVYLPIIGAFLVFTGFWYVKAYFAFFGMNEIIAELSIQYVTQFSFVMLFEILSFKTPQLSILSLLILLGLAVFATLTPNWHISGSRVLKRFRGTPIPIFPFWLRILVVICASFMWLFHISDTIAKEHAKEKINGNFISAKNIDAPASESQYDSLFAAFGYNKDSGDTRPQITEIWRNSDYIYFAKRPNDTNEAIMVIKAHSEYYDLIRSVRNP